MSGREGVVLRWPALVTGSVLLVVAGGLAAYAVIGRAPGPVTRAETRQSQIQSTIAPSNAATRLPDVAVPISRDAAERAGIVVGTVSAGHLTDHQRFPAVVQPNAYKRIAVTPLVSGRVTSVAAELGQTVARGSVIAEVFSPELSEAETRFLGLRAELDAHERELQRTEQLVNIGAASRQELEKLHAEHTAKLAEVGSARSRLSLLGLSPEAIERSAPGTSTDSQVAIRAPIAGVIIERTANAGLNVDPSTALFSIADLSTVWVVADVYEHDFGRIHPGQPATVTFAALPQRSIQGTISYIDPQLDLQTRTAKMRIEVPNPHGELRLGMIGDVEIATSGLSSTPVVPRSALQHVGDRTVVYLARADQPGQFIEREVRSGGAAGDEHVVILEGLAPGDLVVTQGSFAVRAESERLGLRSGGVAGAASEEKRVSTAPAARVLVTEQGYEPSSVTLPAGAHAQITFLRTTDQTCGTEITFPTLNIRQPLPLNQPVTIDITVPKAGTLGFQCGMNMLKGSIVAQ